MTEDHYQHLELGLRVVPEKELLSEDNERIKRLLVAAFPQYRHIFHHTSYYYSKPEIRLWFEDKNGNIVAHLDFERRQIDVASKKILVAGVGEVATQPELHGRGIGRDLMKHFVKYIRQSYPADFGFLQCRPAVVGYYEKVGWIRIDTHHKIVELDINTDEFVVTEGPALIISGTKSVDLWPKTGLVHLRGLPW